MSNETAVETVRVEMDMPVPPEGPNGEKYEYTKEFRPIQALGNECGLATDGALVHGPTVWSYPILRRVLQVGDYVKVDGVSGIRHLISREQFVSRGGGALPGNLYYEDASGEPWRVGRNACTYLDPAEGKRRWDAEVAKLRPEIKLGDYAENKQKELRHIVSKEDYETRLGGVELDEEDELYGKGLLRLERPDGTPEWTYGKHDFLTRLDPEEGKRRWDAEVAKLRPEIKLGDYVEYIGTAEHASNNVYKIFAICGPDNNRIQVSRPPSFASWVSRKDYTYLDRPEGERRWAAEVAKIEQAKVDAQKDTAAETLAEIKDVLTRAGI